MEKAVGDSIRIGDSDYEVTLCRSQLGTKDDIVIFMNLSDAQDLLGLKGKISGILALSCNCAAGDLEPIRNGVRKIVPEAQVVEFTVRAQARARARRVIADAAAAEKADIENSRKNFRKQLEQFSLLFPAITVAAASILLFFLYSHNVKERRHEIAILRTLGVNTIRIYYIFFVKALLLAVIGVLVGYIGSVSSMGSLGAESSFTQLWDWWLALMLLLSACFVSITASIIPVIIAAQQEPGTVLNEEA